MTNYSWKSAISGDWTSVADWTPAGGPPGAADAVTIAVSGAAYTVSVSSADSAGALTLNSAAATLAVNNALTVGGAFTVAAGTIAVQAHGALVVNGLLTNSGAIDDITAGGALTFGASSGFVNQGLLDVGGGNTVTIAGGTFANLKSGVLTGGSYEVDAGSTFAILLGPGPVPIATLAANVILNGAGSNVETIVQGGGVFTIDSTLTSIAASGKLQILGGRNWTLNAAGVQNSGVIALGGGAVSGTSSLTQGAGATLVGFGAIDVAVINAGTIEAKGGTLTLANPFKGPGGFKIDSGATLAFSVSEPNDDLVTLAGGTLSAPTQPLVLAASGHIVGYGAVTAPFLLDSGTIEASGGTLTLTTAVAGAGTLQIDSGADLVFASGTLNASSTFTGATKFAGANATLTISNLSAFQGVLGGFQEGDKLALTQVIANGAHATSSDQLVLTENGATVWTLKTDADYSGFTFLYTGALTGTAFVALPTTPTVADYLADKSQYDMIPGGFSIADTSANILAHLSALGDTHINAIAASSPISVAVATYLPDQYALSKVAGGIVVADTLTHLLTVDWSAAPAYVDALHATGAGTIRSGAIAPPLTLGTGAHLSVAENLTLNNVTLSATASLGVADDDTLSLHGGATLAGSVAGAGTLDIVGGVAAISGVETIANWSSSEATLAFNASNFYAGNFQASDDTLTLHGGRVTLAGVNDLESVTINGAGVADIAGGLTFANGVTLGGSVTLLNQCDEVLQQAGYLTLGAGTSFVNAAGALWELAGDDGVALGAGSHAVVTNAGLIEQVGNGGTVGIAAAVVNTGTLESAAGTLDLQAAVTGAGDDIVQGASALEFDAAVSAGQTVTLTGANGRLVLNDPQHFAATIDGFGGAEALDVNGAWSLLGFKENAAGTAGVLTFADGAARASIHLAGDYAATGFHATSVNGFTVITY